MNSPTNANDGLAQAGKKAVHVKVSIILLLYRLRRFVDIVSERFIHMIARH
jgi:hypothetical protein